MLRFMVSPAYRFWLQNLGFEIHNLYDDVRDGLLLLKVSVSVSFSLVACFDLLARRRSTAFGRILWIGARST